LHVTSVHNIAIFQAFAAQNRQCKYDEAIQNEETFRAFITIYSFEKTNKNGNNEQQKSNRSSKIRKNWRTREKHSVNSSLKLKTLYIYYRDLQKWYLSGLLRLGGNSVSSFNMAKA